MKFDLLISFVLLSSCVLGPTNVISHPTVEVTVRTHFTDGRSVTLACQDYHSNAPAKVLGLSFPTAISYVTWTIQQFTGDTLNKCHMVWTNEHGELIGSMFEAFDGADASNQIYTWDPSTGENKYLWFVNDQGLCLYNFIKESYDVVKSLASLQCIKVNVMNLLGNGEAISIVCMSNEASGLSEIVALGSPSHGNSVGWTIPDFRKGTTQVCQVHFGHGSRPALVFEAFVGSWDHNDVIWDVHTRRRIYDWVLRDTGLFFKDYVSNTEAFVKRLP